MRMLLNFSVFCSILLGCGETPQQRYSPQQPFPDDVQEAAAECLPDKTLGVVGGVRNKDAFPATIKIYSMRPDNMSSLCTAGFIREDRLVTAAHCVDNATSILLVFNYAALSVTGLYSHPQYKGINAVDAFVSSASDVAFINLSKYEVDYYKALAEEKGVAYPTPATIRGTKLSKRDCFAWAGYGRNLVGQSVSDGERRIGANLVYGITGIKDHTLYYSQTYEKKVDPINAVFGKGDSGAPIYDKNGQIVGVVSITASMHGVITSAFPDITNEDMRNFLSQ